MPGRLSAITPEVIDDVRDAARAHPGLGYVALARHLALPRDPALAALRAAVAQGVLHEGPSRVPTRPTRAGVPQFRSSVGLFASPPPAGPPGGQPLVDLRGQRETFGLSAALVASQLGVSPGLLYHWEAGRQPVPGWAIAALPEALERAHAIKTRPPAATRYRRRYRSAILEEVRRCPGQSQPQIARALGIDRQTVAKYLRPLEERGRVHWGPSTIAGKHGPRAYRGVFPGPARLQPPAPSPAQLAAAALRTGTWDGKRVATRLGVDHGAWWRHVREDTPLPPYVDREKASAVYEELLRIARSHRDAITARLREHGPQSLHALESHFDGRVTWWRGALAELEEAGAVHRGSYPIQDARGVTHYRQAYALGPAAAAPAPMTTEELEDLISSRGLSVQEAAELLDLRRGALANWLSGYQPVPSGRADVIRDRLGALPLAERPRRRSRRRTDEELRAAVLEHITAHPGTTRKQTAAAMPGDVRRRWALIAALVEDGTLVEQEGKVRGKSTQLLYPGPGALAPGFTPDPAPSRAEQHNE